jgi:hypothetical protein
MKNTAEDGPPFHSIRYASPIAATSVIFTERSHTGGCGGGGGGGSPPLSPPPLGVVGVSSQEPQVPAAYAVEELEFICNTKENATNISATKAINVMIFLIVFVIK